MVLLQNTAEGGVAGQAVTVANSGGASGDAWSGVAGSIVYAADGAHGNISYEATATGSTFWTVAGTTVRATSPYFKILAAPTAAGLFHTIYTGSGTTTWAARLLVNTSRQIGIQNAAGTQVGGGSSTWALTVGAWYRIETEVTVGTTTSNGSIAVRLYQLDATTPVATYTASGTANTGTTTITRVDTGRLSGSGWGSGPRWDDVRTQDSTTALGPYQAVTGAVSLAGSGTLSAVGAPASASAVALTGSGTLSATGSAGQNIVTVPAASGGDDQTMLAGIFANATAGQTIQFPANSVYKHSGKLALTGASKANITIVGNGAQLIATTPSAASLGVFDGADSVSISNLRHTVQGATTRINQGFDVAPFVFSNVTLGALTDLTSTGSAGLGFYFWKATGGSLTRLTSASSLADGIHFTNGTGGFTATDCQALDAGDDGFAHIGYLSDGAETGRPQNITLVRPYVRDSRARGISYAGARDCAATDVNIDGSLAANVYFAVERGDFNTGETDRCTVTRGRLARAGTSYAAIPNGTNGTGLDQGAVLFLSSGSGAAVTDCKLADVNIGNLAAVNYDTIRAIQYGGTFSGCSATGINLYAGSPSTFVGGNTPASINPATSTDRRAQALPAYGSGGTQPANRINVDTLNGVVQRVRGDSSTTTTVGAGVSLWDDRTANNYDATQPTAGNQPRYIASPKPGASFNGSNQTFQSAAPTQATETLFAVVRSRATSGYHTIRGASGTNASNATILGFINGRPVISRQGVADVLTGTNTVPTDVVTIITMEYSSTTAKLWTNGAANGSTTNPAAAATNQTATIGAGYNGVDQWVGDVFELITVGRVMSDSERASVHSDLSDYYSVAVADYVPAAQNYTGTATLTGTGSLAATGAPSATGATALTGAGSLAAAGATSTSGTATLTGSGALTTTGAPAASGAAALTGTGSLAASGAPTATQTATLAGTGTLSATGTAAQNGTASAQLTGTGTLTATGAPRYTQVITLTATGTLSATGKASTTGTAATSGTGTLTATGAPSSSSAANLTGSGTLTAVTAAQLNATAQLTGIGQLTAVRAGQLYPPLVGPVAAAWASSGATDSAYATDGTTLAAFATHGETTATFATDGIGAGHFAY